MGTRFEMHQRRQDVRTMLETGMASKKIAPYLMERYDLKRAMAYALIKEVSDQLMEEMK